MRLIRRSGVDRRATARGRGPGLSLLGAVQAPAAAWAVLASLLAPMTAHAGHGTWTTSGPDGGEVRSIAFHPADPAVVYAGTQGGLYVSVNRGQTWSETGSGIGRRTVWSIALNPQEPRRMFAQTWGYGGVFGTVDGGASWQVLDIAVHHDFRIMRRVPSPFALYLVDQGQLLASHDNGATWAESTISSEIVRDLAVHPLHPERMLAAVGYQAVASRDGGQSWQPCAVLPEGTERVAFDPVDPEVAFAPTWWRLYRSEDGCQSWQAMEVEWRDRLSILIGDPHRVGTYYATRPDGVWRSTDGGFTWESFGPVGESFYTLALAVSPVDSDMVCFSADAPDERRGVFCTRDGGSSWTIGMRGLHISMVSSVAVNPTDPTVVYAGLQQAGLYWGDGVFLSRDSARSWQLLPGTEEAGEIVALDPQAPDVIYATALESAIIKSLDGGATWQQVWSGFADERIHSLAVDPSRSGTLFCTTYHHFRAYRSDDGGSSWQELAVLGAEDTYRVFPDPRAPGTVFASTNRGLLVSRDWGDSWELSAQGLETPEGCPPEWCFEYYTVGEMIFDQADPAVLFAATAVGPFRSLDGGGSWELAREGLLVCCELDGTWPAECGYRVKVSSAFPPFCEGGPRGMAQDPDDPRTLYVTTTYGTYRTTTLGEAWQQIDRAPGAILVNDVIPLGGGTLLGATYSAGVVRFQAADELPW